MLIDALQHSSNVCNHVRGVNRATIDTVGLLLVAPEVPVMASGCLSVGQLLRLRHEANPQTTTYGFGLGVPWLTDAGEGAVAAGEEAGDA